MSVLAIWIVIILIICFTSSKKNAGKRQQQAEARANKPNPETPESSEEGTAFEEFKSEPFCQASGKEETQAWTSGEGFHEGEEDPEHDHGGITVIEAEEEAEEPSQVTQDMLRGIIWSEILNRKKR